jgi:hypothetical protein
MHIETTKQVLGDLWYFALNMESHFDNFCIKELSSAFSPMEISFFTMFSVLISLSIDEMDDNRLIINVKMTLQWCYNLV